jgi:type II secretory pathway component GspD/PulD (secretin)
LARQNYTLDPNVQGNVTIRVANEPFLNVLRLLLRSANPPLTYSVENGVYIVRPRQAVPSVLSAPAEALTAPPHTGVTRDADGAETYSLTFVEEDVRRALHLLFRAAEVNYIVPPGVEGKVSLEMRRVRFADALRLLTRAAGLTTTVENGIYVVAPASAPNSRTRGAAAPIGPALTVVSAADVIAGLRRPAPVSFNSALPLVPQIKAQIAAQEIDFALQSSMYGPSHPDYIGSKRRLDALRQALAKYEAQSRARQRRAAGRKPSRTASRR